MKYNITIFIWVFLSFLLFYSCSTTKNVPDQKLLLVENVVEVNGKKKTETNLNPYLIQKPNIKMLGIPFQLFAYNMGNPDSEKKWDDKIKKYQDSAHFWTQTLSLKQTVGYANFNKKINEWLFKNGEAPVILDEIKTKKTLKTLYQYYLDQGYFKTQTSYSIDTLDGKKAKVHYRVTTYEPFTLDTIKVQIASPVIDSLYQIYQKKSIIKSQEIFERAKFEREADRLTALFRNDGVYHFSRYAIHFRDIDSTSTDFKTNVLLDIADRIVEEGDSLVETPYQISYIDRVNVYTDYSYLNETTVPKDSIQYNGIHLYASDNLNYKPKFLTRSIFIKPGERYSDVNLELTRKHLRSLNNFKTIRINYEEKENNHLTANILLTPIKRFGFKMETEVTHANIKPFGVSGKISFKNNNTFRGNEQLQLSLQGSFLNSTSLNSNSITNVFFNAWEVGADLSFKVPRISLPFQVEKIIPQKMSPKTTFTIGSSLQKNIGLDKQRFTGIMEYNWQATEKINHSLELINAQFIKNLNIGSFFNIYTSEYRKLELIQNTYFQDIPLEEDPILFIGTVLNDSNFAIAQPEAYQTVVNVLYRYNIITEDVLVPSMSYSFTYNSQSNYKDTDYIFYKIRLSSAGLIANLLGEKNEANDKQIFGTNIAQYIKLDLEYRRHWNMKWNSILAFRTNIGVAIPYGNSDVIPFSRSYFAGGTNDIRAWHIYELGPGSEKSGLEFNVGNFKLLSSLEYRFNIINSFKGAFFVDAGNIWDITQSDLTTDEASFDSLKSLQDIAIGSGFGLRYDFSFLVFRADFGFKTYEPYADPSKKWFNSYNFKNGVINIGINYPF